MAHQSELIEQDILAYLKSQEEKSLLRFITCGSVDDGKSTLIGRLLWDSKMVFEDQLAALEADSKKVGTQGGAIDYALLLDGLQAEREQGITIDVAYRFFSTDRRKFIVADTPGHEQYTRNMVTGASTAKVAVILVDARKGLLTQTRRHSFLVSLVGIRHIVLAINKMDLIGYDEEKFRAIEEDYRTFAAPLGFESITALPISALNGDNIIEMSAETPWYQGPTLMHFLETVQVEDDRDERPFRLPVQWVNRPNLDFRGFCGTIASGTIRPGDEVRVASSGHTSRVARIVTYNGDLEEAVAGQAVTLTLEDEIDISRGDMLTRLDAPPLYTRHPEAHVVWMHDEPLQPGQLYLVKTATGVTPGRVTAVQYAVDVNTLEQKQVATLGLNEIGLARLELDRPVSFDPYGSNRDTGSFILIDRFTNATVAAGMVLDGPDEAQKAHLSQEDSPWAPRRIVLDAVAATNLNVVDLTEEKGLFLLDLARSIEEYLEKGNRILLRLRDLAQMEPVAQLAYDKNLAFEFDRNGDGASVLLFKRGTAPAKGYGDDGTGI
ncbi:sulfate adenylyltransferase subunit CysN [Geomonas terrae]|uniref:Sulfate adenylyltransferase subunit 1 n=1 Tax=Geomonas terrae TaxID=2562681 RepID=A0A4S1CGP3_9BACT|nr:sulfate adenylyltransferase subunit CysN [Geomonas terrae]TGU72737.1 sulfate adenylyltransferase subunit CysN [Geomonas terrae]